jgi:two-component system sensor histidine kinase HydH
MTSDRGRSRSGARWGWLLTTLALGIALGVASWANYRSARDAVSTIDLGQIGVFEQIVMNAFRGTDPGGPLPELDSLVAAYADVGLRFVGMYSPEDGLIVLGGTPLPDPVDPPLFTGAPRPIRTGDRIRVSFPGPRPRGRDSSGPPGRIDPQGGVDPADRLDPVGRPDPLNRTGIVIEFEPLVANQLLDRAFRSLILGALAAGLLMLTALFFWRATLRREVEERAMEEQRRLSTLGELSAVLAHEIRNPLASLKGHAQLLAEGTSPEAPDRKRVDRIVAEALRLEDLTTDLLDFVRTGPLDLAPVRVEDFLRGVVSEAGEGAVALDLTGAPEDWTFDAQRIRQVLVNLLENAVEASPGGTPIDLVTVTEGPSLVIICRDHGEGISEEDLDRIFEPFFTTRTRGTGLGLAVARRIVELHGGTLTARSLPDGGAEFRMTLMERKS